MKDIEKMTKAELRAEAEELCIKYNDAYGNEEFKVAKDLAEELEQVVNKYTNMARTECFDALKATENPMIEAIKQLVYPTIRIVDRNIGDTDVKILTRVIDDIEKPIDLLKLNNHVEGGIGANKQWANFVEKLNLLLTVQKAKDLGIDPKDISDSYNMNAISKEIDMGKTPTSKTNILKTLNMVVSAMLGEEYKATSHDVAFLMSVYSKKNRKALTVTVANHRHLRQYMAEICHRIILDKQYGIEYKKVKTA